MIHILYFRQSPFNRSRPLSATGSISISQKRLRPTDPVSQLLDIVHKIVYISFVCKKNSNFFLLNIISYLIRFHRIQIIINIVV
jgi:hypothetical protein